MTVKLRHQGSTGTSSSTPRGRLAPVLDGKGTIGRETHWPASRGPHYKENSSMFPGLRQNWV